MRSSSIIADSQLLCLQRALDSYHLSRSEAVETILANHLTFSECAALQKRHFLKDLLLNPLNTLWAIPYLSFRKVMETCEKLGWLSKHSSFSKVPQNLKTDFQKEIEILFNANLFNLSASKSRTCQLTAAFEKESELKASMTPLEWQEFLEFAQTQVRRSVAEFCSKQNAFTDLVSSGVVLLFAHFSFGDNSLDIFKLSRNIARLWAKNDATNHFIFGKSLGHAFYSVAGAPPPTTAQIFITTVIGVSLLALLSTAAAFFSYPLQKAVGFQKKQLEDLVGSVSDKLLIELSKKLKHQSKIRLSS